MLPLAHAGGWFEDPLALSAITLLGTFYFAVVYGPGSVTVKALGGSRIAAFSVALLAIFIATNSPLAGQVEGTLSAHMVQHMLLVSLAAPLLAWGMPLVRLSPALPRRIAHVGIRVNAWLRGSVRAMGVAVALAVTIHAAVLWGWHVPALYESALQSRWVHQIEHLTFLGTAVLGWSVIFAFGAVLRPSLVIPVGLFALAAQGAALGALMAFSERSWYPAYGHGESAVVDQQLAGLIMWGFGATAPVVAAFGLAVAWLVRSRRHPPRRDPPAVAGASPSTGGR